MTFQQGYNSSTAGEETLSNNFNKDTITSNKSKHLKIAEDQ